MPVLAQRPCPIVSPDPILSPPWPARITCPVGAPEHALCLDAAAAIALELRLSKLERYARYAYAECVTAVTPAP